VLSRSWLSFQRSPRPTAGSSRDKRSGGGWIERDSPPSSLIPTWVAPPGSVVLLMASLLPLRIRPALRIRACLAQVQPVDVGLFAGVMDYSKLSFMLRLMMKAMGSPEGDFRDWEAIRAWASQVRARLV